MGEGWSVASIEHAGPLDKAATVEEPEIPHLLALTAARLRGKGALSAQHQRSTRDGGSGVAKPEWGAKRICHNCGARYYDMRRDPIICPKCGPEFDPEAFLKSRRTRVAAVEDLRSEEHPSELQSLMRNSY